MKFDVMTASPAEIAAHVETVFRAEHWNHIRKAEKLADFNFALSSDGQLQYQIRAARAWSDVSAVALLSPEELAAHKNLWLARRDWLLNNPGDDLPAEVCAAAIKNALRGCGRVAELRSAADWCREVDEYSEHYAPGEKPMEKTPTHAKISKRLSEAIEEVRDQLVSVLTREEVAFVIEVANRSWRTHERFWLQTSTDRDCHGASVAAFRLHEVELRGRYGARAGAGGFTLGGFWSANFERCIRNARTLAEARRLCAVWRTPVKVCQTAAGRIVLAEEQTGDGAQVFAIAPIEAKQSPEAFDALQAARWGKED